MAIKTGQDIESICGKCGDVWHVVVAMVGTNPVQVQCKECGAVHRYRPPAKVKEQLKQQAKAEAAKGKPAPARASSPGTPRKPRLAVEPDGPRVAVDRSRPPRTYRPIETYVVGDSLQHLQFGVGVVESTAEQGKITVWFPEGRKTLVHGRGGAQSSSLPERKPSAFE